MFEKLLCPKCAAEGRQLLDLDDLDAIMCEHCEEVYSLRDQADNAPRWLLLDTMLKKGKAIVEEAPQPMCNLPVERKDFTP